MELQVIFSLAIISTWTFFVGGELIDDTSGVLKYRDLEAKDGLKYRIYQKRIPWQDALDFCSKCYGDFATLDTAISAENLLVGLYDISHFNADYDEKKEQNEWGLDRRYWVGLTEKDSPGTWTWKKKPADAGTDAVAISSYKWYPKQPDKANEAEHCGGFWNPGYYIDTYKGGNSEGHQETHSFNDFPCDHKHYFVCKPGTPDAADDASCTAEAWVEGTPAEGGAAIEPIVPAPDGGGAAIEPIVPAPDDGGAAIEPIVPAPDGGGAAIEPIVPAPDDGGAAIEPIVPAPDGGGVDPVQAPTKKRSPKTTLSKSTKVAKRTLTKAKAANKVVKKAAQGSTARAAKLVAHTASASVAKKPAGASSAPKPKVFKREDNIENSDEMVELETNVVSAED